MAIQNIFVVGAGLMGSGIAQTAMTSGYHVILNDQRQETLERARMGIESRLKHMVEKGTMSEEEFQNCMGRLKIDTRLSAAREADLVVEAIFENLEAKQAVFRQLEEICPDHTIFASNTSSISLTALAAIIRDLDLRRPIYRQVAAYGHFGRSDLDLPWEKLDRVEKLKAALEG